MNFRTHRRALAAVLLLAGAMQVQAADLGTNAGTSVTNEASVSFSVGGVLQTVTPSDDVSFVVDRKVDVVVANVADASVSPNATNQVLEYTVTNKTNDALDFILSTSDGGGTFVATGVEIWVDDGDGNFEGAGQDTLVSYIDNLAEDASATVFVVADIPSGAADGETDVFWLTAQAAAPTGTSGSPGAALAESGAADDPLVVENVFADSDGPAAEGAQDGQHSAAATYTVATTSLSVTKTYKVIYEDAANTTSFSDAGDLKPIPGALVEFCILVSNGGGVDAQGVTISDTLGAPNTVISNATWVAESIKVGTSCDYTTATGYDDDAVDETGDDDATGTSANYNSGTGVVTSNVETLSGGSSTATMFRVILN